MTPEGAFKSKLISRLESMFPGCLILKPDPNDIQGIPDLLILYESKWAALECKKASTASRRPNQEYYINTMDTMSYASFIFPENEEEVLYELQQTFGIRR